MIASFNHYLLESNMTQILVRNLSQATVKALKEIAKKNGRSLESEVRMILSEVTNNNFNIFVEDLNKIHKLLGNKKRSDSSKLIREDRNR